MLNLILGYAGSGKSRYILKKIEELGSKGIKSVLIVPEQFSHGAERDMCALLGPKANLYSEVVSFTRLSNRVFAAAGGLSVKNLDPGGRVLVMNAALTALAPKLRVYGGASRKTDFIAGLIAAHDELVMSCTDFDGMRNAAETVGGILGEKLLDMADIFEAYHAMIPKDKADPKGRITEMAEKIADSHVLDGKHVFLDGFTDFTQQQIEVIKTVLKNGTDITAALGCGALSDESPMFELPRLTVDRLQKIASEVKTKCSITYLAESGEGRTPEMEYVCGHLFEDEPEKFEGSCKNISIYYEMDAARECELAAWDILRNVKERGLRWRDIVVAVSGFDDYADVCESVFEKYGIPVMITKRQDILQKPVMALVLGALGAVTGGWEYEDIFKGLKTGLWGISLEDTDILENYVLKWNIRGRKLWTRDEPWELDPEGYNMAANEEKSALLEKIDGLRRKIAGPLEVLYYGLRESADASQMVLALYGFLEALGLAQRLFEKTEHLEDKGKMQLSDEYRQIWDILVSALEESYDVLKGHTAAPDEFLRLMQLVLSQYSVGSIPVSVDRVSVGEFDRVRKNHVKHLVVIGAADERMPRISEGTGLFSGDDRDRLGAAGINLSDGTDTETARQLGYIYSVLTLPKESASFIYSPDSGGRRRLAADIQKLKTAMNIEEQSLGDEIYMTAEKPMLELAFSAINGDGGKAAAAFGYFAKDSSTAEKLQRVKKYITTEKSALSESSAKKLYSGQVNVTASRAEKFLSCKYGYFLQYGLKLKRRKKAEFDAPEIGTFMHDIFENTAKEAEKLGGFSKITDEKIREITRGFVQRYIDRNLSGFKDKNGRFVFLFKRLADETEQIVLDMAKELSNAEFRPVDFELDFSKGGDMPPCTYADGAVSVRGKVDRVDGWMHNGKLYLRVIDYKTGRKSFNLSDVWYGMGIQMLIYLFALQKYGKDRYGTEVEPAGVLYVPARDKVISAEPDISDEKLQTEREKNIRRSGIILDDPDVIRAMEDREKSIFMPVKIGKDGSFSGDSLVSAEQLGKLAKHIELILERTGREIGCGEIKRDPYLKGTDESACDYCDFKSVCHINDSGAGVKNRFLRKMKNQEVWEKIGGETDNV